MKPKGIARERSLFYIPNEIKTGTAPEMGGAFDVDQHWNDGLAGQVGEFDSAPNGTLVAVAAVAEVGAGHGQQPHLSGAAQMIDWPIICSQYVGRDQSPTRTTYDGGFYRFGIAVSDALPENGVKDEVLANELVELAFGFWKRVRARELGSHFFRTEQLKQISHGYLRRAG